jgi:hypothetical protein
MYLQQFARVQCPIFFPSPFAFLRCVCLPGGGFPFLTTIRREAFNGGDVPFGNAAIIKVLEALNTEYVGAEKKFVAYGAFFGI